MQIILFNIERPVLIRIGNYTNYIDRLISFELLPHVYILIIM